MRDWELRDAERRFATVARLAVDCGPQRIRGVGRAAVVVLSEAEYRRLIGNDGSDRAQVDERPGLVEFMQSSPLAAAFRDGLLPEDIFDQIREESRRAASFQATQLSGMGSGPAGQAEP